MARCAVTESTGRLGSLGIAGMLGLEVAPDDVVAVAGTPAKATALREAGLQVRYGDYAKPVMLPAAQIPSYLPCGAIAPAQVIAAARQVQTGHS